MSHADLEAQDEVARLRVPPHSVEAEQSVLGALLLDNSAWDRVTDLLVEADFYRHDHRLVFAAIGGLINACRPADVITVAERLRGVKGGESVGASYLLDLSNSVPSARNARRYAEIVKDKSLCRALIAASDEAATLAFNGEGNAAEKASAIATRFTDLQTTTIRKVPRSADELAVELLDRVTDLYEGQVPVAWGTGFDHLDNALSGGLRPGKVYVLAARPSVGKSSLAQAILLHCAKAGQPAAMLSQEMESSECMDRAAANLGTIDYEHIQTGKLTDFEWQFLSNATELMRQLPFWVDDEAGLSLQAIRAKAISLRQQGLKVLAIDYLQLCDYQAAKGQTTNDALGNLSKGIKRLAKDLGIAIVLLSQLNREVERRAHPEPNLADLRDSGAIEQDADVVLLLWQAREFSDRRIMGLTVAKNRQGKFKGRLALEFFGTYQQWRESSADINPSRKPAETNGGFE